MSSAVKTEKRTRMKRVKLHPGQRKPAGDSIKIFIGAKSIWIKKLAGLDLVDLFLPHWSCVEHDSCRLLLLQKSLQTSAEHWAKVFGSTVVCVCRESRASGYGVIHLFIYALLCWQAAGPVMAISSDDPVKTHCQKHSPCDRISGIHLM